MLHHLANPDESLKNLKDLLKPTGSIGLMVYANTGVPVFIKFRI
ncbi:MAG: hypothetical protein O7C68_05230 [Rickettsia endosymbiont of Ixodes ricinus]|nr:hypothetical protein [Rickettsia helvetica]MCZ6883813.1 hypothetical protein [Rickettsia endosymbiont of Ixodes ricinus]MCZ6896967.1 hypothetical protein [Rickettsia endosymbiont of Ixodes ricinus]